MSSGLVFPVLAGRGWSVTKEPMWNTKIQTAVSGREFRASYYSSCRWKFTLTHEVLRADATNHEMQTLMGFYNRMQGSWDDFFFIDPSDYQATDVVIGTGNGSNRDFLITRPWSTFLNEPVLPSTTPVVKVNGTPVSLSNVSYGIQSAIATLAVAPANGATVTWTGPYYFRCRFKSDTVDFENFMYQLWTVKKLEFITLK